MNPLRVAAMLAGLSLATACSDLQPPPTVRDSATAEASETAPSDNVPPPQITDQNGTPCCIVLFGFGEATLGPDGQQVIKEALAEAKTRGLPPILVIGHADRAGPEGRNVALSLRRANAVRQALIEGGIPASQIVVSGRGEIDPSIATADGVREQGNRFVQIIMQI